MGQGAADAPGELDRDLAAFGLPPLPRAEAAEAEHGALWLENVEGFELFVSLDTQWSVAAGMNSVAYLGLDNARVEATMRMRRIPLARRAALLAELRDFEHGALPILNARRDG